MALELFELKSVQEHQTSAMQEFDQFGETLASVGLCTFGLIWLIPIELVQFQAFLDDSGSISSSECREIGGSWAHAHAEVFPSQICVFRARLSFCYPRFCRFGPNLGHNWANLTNTWSKSGNFGRTWSTFDPSWPNLTEVDPKLSKFGRTWPNWVKS